jgi:hypothetical protein
MSLSIKNFGNKSKTLDADSVELILEINKKQNLGARVWKKNH